MFLMRLHKHASALLKESTKTVTAFLANCKPQNGMRNKKDVNAYRSSKGHTEERDVSLARSSRHIIFSHKIVNAKRGIEVMELIVFQTLKQSGLQ